MNYQRIRNHFVYITKKINAWSSLKKHSMGQKGNSFYAHWSVLEILQGFSTSSIDKVKAIWWHLQGQARVIIGVHATIHILLSSEVLGPNEGEDAKDNPPENGVTDSENLAGAVAVEALINLFAAQKVTASEKITAHKKRQNIIVHPWVSCRSLPGQKRGVRLRSWQRWRRQRRPCWPSPQHWPCTPCELHVNMQQTITSENIQLSMKTD